MLIATLMMAGTSLLAQPPGYSAPDYDAADAWLCRPGREDACTIDLDSTVVEADGSTRVDAFTAASDPGVDCFYVYPTVSNDLTPNSDMIANAEENSVISAQFARFGEVCRTFAPMYRQITLTALRTMMSGQPVEVDGVTAYLDVQTAFQHYLEHDNNGRPFVLIGHSQGARMLEPLVARLIDGQPIQERMLSAMLIGYNVAVPPGERVGGAFQSVPTCQSADQTGCLISYVSFRADAPPPEGARFGNLEDPAVEVACTNPADLLGNGDAALNAYLSAGGAFTSSAEPAPWVEGGGAITSDFVQVPGMLTGQCVNNEHGSYFAITVTGDPSDPRVDDIVGDVVANGTILADWGLHLLDVGIAQGDLIDLVARQAEAYSE